MPEFMVSFEARKVSDVVCEVPIEARNMKEARAKAEMMIAKDQIEDSQFEVVDSEICSLCVGEITKL